MFCAAHVDVEVPDDVADSPTNKVIFMLLNYSTYYFEEQ